MSLIPQKLTGWALPAVGLGTNAWGAPYPYMLQEQASELVRFARSQGPALFDTAPLYGYGQAEEWLGEALVGVPRDSYVLSSKAGYSIIHGERARMDLSRYSLINSLEGSLARLRTNWLDILYLHNPECCLQDATEVAFPILAELRDQGLIRAVGVEMDQWQPLETFARSADLDCFFLVGRYTLLEQESLDFLDLCWQKGITLFLGEIYNTGILESGAAPGALYNHRPAAAEILERVARMEGVAHRYGVTLRSAALQFPLAHPAVRSLVIGAHTAAEFENSLEALSAPVPVEFWEDLRRERLIDERAPVPKEITRR